MTVWGTTDYMFRGISNSDGPAIQASIDWTYSGFYLGLWGSNTEFSDQDIEIDGYGGYRWSWFGWGFDVAGLYYWFPDEDENSVDNPGDKALDPGGGQEADYIEAQLLVSRSFDTAWSPSVAFKYNYSPDFFGEDGDAHHVQGDGGVLVPLGFLGDVGFSATVGYQTVEGDKSSGSQLGILQPDGSVLDGYDYVWWRFGVYKDIAGFKVDVSYHATDESEDLETFFPNTPQPGDFRDLIEPHVVLTVSRTFSFP
ncbi:MAG: TorF family putative porin [Chromatiales bacterium]